MSLRFAIVGRSTLVFVLTASGIHAQTVDFRRDVAPILQKRCRTCHGAKTQESGLRLDSGYGVLSGGNSGNAVVPGKSDESLLIHAVLGQKGVTRMPPEEQAKPLSAGEVVVLRRWIDAGAKLPDDEPPRVEQATTEHWAFEPPVRPRLPAVTRPAWPRRPVDAFVLNQLEMRQLTPSSEADRVALARRLHLDLVGLPPGPSDIDSFLADASPDAYERLVDRLLASPHYGERFGRLWLDQARYADSDGYSNDLPRVHWLYRNYVIDSLNRDLSFDRFVVEQLAGDLLPGASQDQIVATGFHRNTQLYSEGDSATEEYRVESIVDRVDTTGVVFLGLTLGCARCHDHKFDPVSQREFYQLFAFFNDQDEPTESFAVETPELRAVRETLEAAKLAGTMNSAEATTLAAREQQLLAEATRTTALVLRERQQPRETRIHVRGDFTRLGRRVEPDVPQVLNALGKRMRRANRLDFARWLIAPENPLLARVTINRMWRTFLGRAIVETDNDFGTQGDRPTHPELLDWLAVEFRERGWHIKAMHRMIVTSSTYRQASATRPENRDADPQNLYWARQNRFRLDAELVRDVTLSAAGLLSTKLKGPSVFPPQPDGVMRLTQNGNRTWEPSPGEDRYRRGLYTFFWRLTPHPLLTTFDAPEANVACTRRPRANTPLQALTLLNDAMFVEAADALAMRVIREAGDESNRARLRHAFRLCVAREPSEAELTVLSRLLSEEHRAANDAEVVAEKQAWRAVARVLLNLDETITRE